MTKYSHLHIVSQNENDSNIILLYAHLNAHVGHKSSSFLKDLMPGRLEQHFY